MTPRQGWVSQGVEETIVCNLYSVTKGQRRS
jgi:hypothetical protein